MATASSDLLTLRLSGSSPREWGLQHGEAFAAAIGELAEIRTKLLADELAGWSREKIDGLCGDQLAALEQRWPDTLAELRGISEGSGVSMSALVVLNAYTDLKDFASEAAPGAEGGCSALAVKGPRANFAAQTWDMHASAEPYTLLLEIPAARPGVRVLTLTGCLGLSGVNSAGVGVMINNLQTRQTNRAGMIWPGLVRLLLEQCSAEAAAVTLAANLPSSGHNYLLSDRDTAINIETTGRRYERTRTIGRDHHGAIVHSNHYLGMLASEECAGELGPTTHARLAALEQFLAEHALGDLTGKSLRQSLFQQGPLCETVCLPPPTEPHGTATCGGMALDYLEGRALAYRGRHDPSRGIEWSI